VIISAFKHALKDALEIIDEISLPVDIDDDKAMYQLISSSIGTKFVSRWSELMCNLALKAVRTVTFDIGGGKKEVDIKRYARVEKIPGGEIEDSRVLDGVMLNKDITHPKMRRRIENPRIVLLDCTLEYKKGESQTNIEISKEDDWNKILQIEEEQVKLMCDAILAVKPDLVITEKGVSGMSESPKQCSLLITSRPGPTLLDERQRDCPAPSPQDRQQQNSPSGRSHRRQPSRRPHRSRCRNSMRPL
jgi:T-complex protein 1 subunit gamma